MKKIFCAIGLLVVILSILGCDENIDSEIRVLYGERGGISIEVPEKTLVREHPYDIVYTDDGCDVIIHFTKAKEIN